MNPAFLSLWEKFWTITFWLSLPAMAFILWRIIVMEKKYWKRRRQLQKDLHFPEMESTRTFLKPTLKERGIKFDDKFYEKN